MPAAVPSPSICCFTFTSYSSTNKSGITTNMGSRKEQQSVICSFPNIQVLITTRRVATLHITLSALYFSHNAAALPLPLTDASPDFRLYSDDANKYHIFIPQELYHYSRYTREPGKKRAGAMWQGRMPRGAMWQPPDAFRQLAGATWQPGGTLRCHAVPAPFRGTLFCFRPLCNFAAQHPLYCCLCWMTSKDLSFCQALRAFLDKKFQPSGLEHT